MIIPTRVLLMLATIIGLAGCDLLNAGGPRDTVTINVTGLPDELDADIVLTGPGDLRRELTDDLTLEEATAGAYTLTTEEVTYQHEDSLPTPFTPERASISFTLAEGGYEKVTVAYIPHLDFAEAALERLNYYRRSVGSEPITYDGTRSLPNWLHARYAAETQTTGHSEDPSNPWYTPEGHASAQASQIMYGSGYPEYPQDSADGFANAPFHFFDMIDPRVTRIRLGFYAAMYDYTDLDDGTVAPRDRRTAVYTTDNEQPWPTGTTLLFPGRGQSTYLLDFRGENPSPITGCDGYEEPTGLPIFAMRGPDFESESRNATMTLERDGTLVEDVCLVTGATYENPEADTQSAKRYELSSKGVTMLIPRDPLEPNATYTVTYTSSDRTITWPFHTTDPDEAWALRD